MTYARGALLADEGHGLVYGGGSVGLMNEVAQGALDRSGEVIGVIPQKLLDLEVGRRDLSELFVVQGMHARKLKMAELSDAFIAMPGGYGTLEELFEVTTWTQLNYHRKPVGLLNVAGYFDGLVGFLDHANREGFIRDLHRPLVQCHSDPRTLLANLKSQELPHLKQWISAP
jgi:uncharacterized protein (TIGR00730 family)